MGIWVGRYAIVGGAVREHGPWLVDRERVREDERVRLLVLAEPVDDRSAPFCSEVAEAVAALFSRESLSVTGGLQRALRQAHANLAEWNRRSLREHHVAVGVSCLAIRDREVTIAQAGPGVVYAQGATGLRRLSTIDTPAATALGSEGTVDPQFFTTTLGEARLLMLTSSVDRELPPTTVQRALEAGRDEALAQLYSRTQGFGDMAAVLVAEGPDVPPADLRADASVGVSADADREPPPPSPPVASTPSRAPVRAASLDIEQPLAGWPDFEDATAQAGGPSAGAPLPGGRTAPGRSSRLPSLRPALARPSGKAALPALRRLRRLSTQAGMDGGRPPWRAVGLVAGVVLVMLVLAWCTLPGLLEQDRGAQFDDAVRAAESHLTAASAARDAASSRQELQAALAEITRARSVRADDPAVGDLQQRADRALADLDAVVDLSEGSLRRVLAFEGSITAPFNAASLVAGDGNLWLLDGQRGRVFRVDPAGVAPPEEVYRAGATYGGVAAREPRAMGWDSTGGRLLLVDGGSSLFAITPGGAPGRAPEPVPLRGARELRSVAALATYRGNLYVLDPTAGEVWRYLPAGAGFDSERSGLLGGVDIGDARALVVDGDLYVLGASALRRFEGNREQPALLQGIDHPVADASGVAVDSVRRVAYVADHGGRRIVVGDREGLYLRQYRHPQFFDLRGVALGAGGDTIYALTGDGIYAFSPSAEGARPVRTPPAGGNTTPAPAATGTPTASGI